MKTLLVLVGSCFFVGCVGQVETEGDFGEDTKSLYTERCVDFRERAFECRETVVDRWIDVRAKYHPDIADAMATAQKRAQLRKVALTEFTQDGSGPRAPRVAACRAVVERMPPQAERVALEFEACGAKTSCEAWSTCVLPVFEQMNRAMTRRQ